MEQSDNNQTSIKKYIINNISYTLNKKMNSYNIKIDSITNKLDANLELSLSIIDLLQKNTLELHKKISLLENKLDAEIIKNKKSDCIFCNNEHPLPQTHISRTTSMNLIDAKVTNNEQNINYTNLEDAPLSGSCHENTDLKYKEFKINNFFLEIDKEYIKKCLNMTSINGDIKMFTKMYTDNIPKEYYPIRHIKKKFQYWNNGHMVDDNTNGEYIKNVILKNIEQCYLSVNVFNNCDDDIDDFLKNQEHINKMMEQKYKDKFLTKIIQIIDI